MSSTSPLVLPKKTTGTAADPVVQKLAKNPEHFREFFDLDKEATDALTGVEDLGKVRRKVWAFEQRMKDEYGRRLTGADCTMARLIHSASNLLHQTQGQEVDVGQSEMEQAGTVSVRV